MAVSLSSTRQNTSALPVIAEIAGVLAYVSDDRMRGDWKKVGGDASTSCCFETIDLEPAEFSAISSTLYVPDERFNFSTPVGFNPGRWMNFVPVTVISTL